MGAARPSPPEGPPGRDRACFHQDPPPAGGTQVRPAPRAAAVGSSTRAISSTGRVSQAFKASGGNRGRSQPVPSEPAAGYGRVGRRARSSSNSWPARAARPSSLLLPICRLKSAARWGLSIAQPHQNVLSELEAVVGLPDQAGDLSGRRLMGGRSSRSLWVWPIGVKATTVVVLPRSMASVRLSLNELFFSSGRNRDQCTVWRCRD